MGGRCLGLDVGRKRIGVALSDSEGMIALPLTTIRRENLDSATTEVARLVQQNDVACVVMGLPALLSGELGEEAHRVQEFAAAAQEKLQVPVEFWDERLSTVAAEKMMLGAGTKKEKREEHRDAMAAALILQAYLDHKRMALE